MGNEGAEKDGVIDWNFDHDDLTKAIHNIASKNLEWVQFPIFGGEEGEGSSEAQEDDVEPFECVSELSDGVVEQAHNDTEEM